MWYIARTKKKKQKTTTIFKMIIYTKRSFLCDSLWNLPAFGFLTLCEILLPFLADLSSELFGLGSYFGSGGTVSLLLKKNNLSSEVMITKQCIFFLSSWRLEVIQKFKTKSSKLLVLI